MQNKGKQIAINIISGMLAIFIFLLTVFFLISTSVDIVFIKTNVKGYSMYPTINATTPSIEEEWDTVYINRYRACAREDIVVANVSWYGNSIIKRLVALPGDTIRMQLNDNKYELYVNEKLVRTQEKTSISPHNRLGGTEEYFNKYLSIINNSSLVNVITNGNGDKCIKLNNNQYFLMGDNWAETTDCMTYGPISYNCIVGKVELIVDHNQDSTQTFVKYLWKTLFS